jgi:hypothetical protein
MPEGNRRDHCIAEQAM